MNIKKMTIGDMLNMMSPEEKDTLYFSLLHVDEFQALGYGVLKDLWETVKEECCTTKDK